MQINWKNVKRVLVVRLRSIGDTVLATPSLVALKRFLPDAQIDILVEDWVAPLLEGFDAVDNIVSVGKSSYDRLKIARLIYQNRYDTVFNLHGGTTSAIFTKVTGARHRVGYANYQFPFLYNNLLTSPTEFWKVETTHSAEQQLALLGFVGIPVQDRPKSRLAVTKVAAINIDKRLEQSEICTSESAFALIHPVAASATKTWAVEKFASIAEYLDKQGLKTIAVATPNEQSVLDKLTAASDVPIISFNDLTLPEITALASRAKLFVGNDSGIAHIAAAVKIPTVVIFGASNTHHWFPWTDAPNEIVFSEAECEHFKGHPTIGTEEPKCIQCISTEKVIDAIERVCIC